MRFPPGFQTENRNPSSSTINHFGSDSNDPQPIGDMRQTFCLSWAGTGAINKLYFGDNLDVLREKVKDESVDLVYLDPPFNSAANYNVLFRAPSGEESDAQAEAFRDTWELQGRHANEPR